MIQYFSNDQITDNITWGKFMRKGIFESSHPHQVYFEETFETNLNHVLLTD